MVIKDSVEVQEDPKLMFRIRHLIKNYQVLFRDKPRGIAVSPTDWLTLGVTLAHKGYGSYCPSDRMQIDEVEIFVKMDGPIEILPNLKDAAHILFLKKSGDEKYRRLIVRT